MSSRRVAVPLAVLALAGLGTACEKPSPFVTLYSNGVVVKTRASQFCHEPDDCRTKDVSATLTVRSPATIAIDVPREVAEAGWGVLEEGTNEVSHDHYRTIGPVRFERGQRQPLTIVRYGEGGQVSARWTFTIVGR